MNRLGRTRQLLAQHCLQLQRGLDAAELAQLMGAASYNVSADLNELWRRRPAPTAPALSR